MKRKLHIPYSGLSLIMFAMIIAGCGSKSYEKQHYILDTQRVRSAVVGKKSSVVEVRRFTIASAFGSKSLIYRTGEFRYKSDFYNEFLVSPSTMITEKTHNWLSESGLFDRVMASGSDIDQS